MSELNCFVTNIDDIIIHPTADRLEICIVGGWQCVTSKGLHYIGKNIVYIPPDSVLPVELSDAMGITKFLSNGRVKVVKLRGEPSFGIITDAKEEWELGYDAKDDLGITKYFAPVKVTASDALPEDAMLQKFTDIQNNRTYKNVFVEGEEVRATEKVDGTSSKVLYNGVEFMCASKNHRRAEGGLYWIPVHNYESVRTLLIELYARFQAPIILYGEIYGRGVPNGDKRCWYSETPSYVAYDLRIGGKFVAYQEFSDYCLDFKVPQVPLISAYPYSLEKTKELASGLSVLANGLHSREGVVIRPIVEREERRVGRVILKYVNDWYLTGDNDFTDS